MSDHNLLKAESHFAFGKNWLDYAAKIDEARIAQAVADLQRLSGRERFDGLSFLDIGCGSGLHALAAIRMGAARVVGVDIDADSVAASRGTLARFAPEPNARFDVVSVFDMTPQTHGGFDLVYSWGVLHHTGDMRRALTVAASLVQPGGDVHGGAVPANTLLWNVAENQALVFKRVTPLTGACTKPLHSPATHPAETARPQSRRRDPRLRQAAGHGLLQRRARLDGWLSLRVDQPGGLSRLFFSAASVSSWSGSSSRLSGVICPG